MLFRSHKFDPWVGKIPWRRKWQPTLLFLPGKSHGHRSLPNYSPWCCKESDTTEQLTHTHTHTHTHTRRMPRDDGGIHTTVLEQAWVWPDVDLTSPGRATMKCRTLFTESLMPSCTPSAGQPGPGCTAGQREGPEAMQGPTAPPSGAPRTGRASASPPSSTAEGCPLAEA